MKSLPPTVPVLLMFKGHGSRQRRSSAGRTNGLKIVFMSGILDFFFFNAEILLLLKEEILSPINK